MIMEDEGMVAVVRGLRDSGLAVTLLESGRQYTLLPNAASQPGSIDISNTTASQSNKEPRESAAQAIDGRYASTYKITHCHLTPTSPPEQVTEFPPQKSEICPGYGNFEVGGQGSGENHCLPTRSSSFRGAMCWADRGAVFSPRPSIQTCQTDLFANSLRKYPNLSQDRSEIVERLINFTQIKNSTRNRSPPSPVRNTNSNVSSHIITMDVTRQTRGTQRCEPEVNIRPKRSEESPIKEGPRKVLVEREPVEPWRRSTFSRTNDVRYLRDVSRKPSHQAEPLVRERYNSPAAEQRRTINQCCTNSVNMEIQAAVQMVSKEIVTVPRIIPSQRTVAVSLTPTSSFVFTRKSEGSVACANNVNLDTTKHFTEFVQPNLDPVDCTNSVNMEIQDNTNVNLYKYYKSAAVQMVSKEIVTVPRIIPSQRTVAVSLTPTSSFVFTRKSEGLVACANNANLDTTKHFTEFVQPNLDPVDVNIQTVLSAIEISNHKCRYGKRCKSQDEIRFNESMKNEILHLIQRLPLSSNYCGNLRFNRKSHKSFSSKRVEDTKHIYNSRERKLVRDFSKMNSKYVKTSLARTFYAEVSPFGMIDEDDLTKLLQDWIKLIPFKKTDGFSINVNKESLFNEIFEFIKNGEYSLKGFDKGYNLKNLILNKLESIPLEIRGNRWVYQNKLADILVDYINKTERIPCEHLILDEDREIRNHKSKFKINCPSELELRNFVLKELLTFVQNSDSRFNQRQIKELENELIDVLSVSAKLLRGAQDKHLIKNIIELLVHYGVSDHKAIYFTKALMKHFKKDFIVCRGERKIRSETFIVLANTETIQTNGNATSNSLSIKSINEDDIQANVDSYTKDLCREIDDWLTQLPISIAQEKGFRQLVANDLAGDIVDRHRYIELNPTYSKSSETELDHLKYLIFKCLDKFECGDNLETSRFVSDLMKRINNIPVPMLSRLRDLQKANVNNSKASTTIHFKTIPPYEKTLIIKTPPEGNQPPLNYKQEQQVYQQSIRNNDNVESNQTQKSVQCCSDITNLIAKTNDELQEEYASYVKDWVKLIPIQANTPEEQDIADKARLGIHNGIWKAVSKLDSDPATYYNRFFYEDLFDEEIESLLDCLPQTPELQSKKHLLKARLIEKTSDIQDLLKANEEISFRYNLIKTIFSSLRKLGIPRGNNSVKNHEDMQVKKIVEEFLLCTNFRSENKVKAEIYKKKLMKHIEDFINDLKQHHPNETKNVDVSLHKADIINILLQVRLPRESIIKQEADSILLDLEIEQWYLDLPIVPSNDYKEQYKRSKQREFLVKKVKDFENGNNDFSESALRLEVSNFLEKLPLKEGENLNKSYMVEEFINRIKNRPKQETTQHIKQVTFETIPNYEDFSKDISFCSSFINCPRRATQTLGQTNDDKNEPKQCLKSCPRIVTNNLKLPANNVSPQSLTNRSHIVIDDQPTYRTFNEHRPMSSKFHPENSNQQSHALEETQPTTHTKMFAIPPYRSPEHTMPQRQEQQFLQLPEKNVIQKSFYPGRPVGSTSYPEISNQQWHKLEEAQTSTNRKMFDIPPYRSPEQRQEQQFLQLPEENVIQKSFYAGRSVGSTFHPENRNQQWHMLEEAQTSTNRKMFDIPPYRSPEQRQEQQFLQLPEENVIQKSFYAGRPVGSTFHPENNNQQWHMLEEAQTSNNRKMFDIPPYRSPEQRIPQRQEQKFLQLPEENVIQKSFYAGRPVGSTFHPENSNQQWHTLEDAQTSTNIKMYAIPPYRSPEQRISQRQERQFLQLPEENVIQKSFYAGRPVGSTFHPENSNQQWHTLEETQPATNTKMFAISSYRSPEHRIPQRQEQQSVQRPEENVIQKSVMSPKKADFAYGSGTEPKQSTNVQLYQQEGKEDYGRTKSSKGILGTSQVAGPSGYNSKFSKNVNNNYYKPETYAPPPEHLLGSCSCDLCGDSCEYKTKLYDEQIPQITNKCSAACQTDGILRPDPLRKGNLIQREVKQNASTNTSYIPPMYSATPHNTCSNDTPCPNVKPDIIAIEDKRRPLNLVGSEENENEVPCRCIEKYLKRFKRCACENYDNYPPCAPWLFPYPRFF